MRRMTMIDKIQEIKELVLKLNQYRNEYYNQNNPTVSDDTYDSLIDKLKSLEIETNFIMSNSPTREVGYSVVGKLEKVKHDIPLLSLDKTKSIDDVMKFVSKAPFLIMLKYDGLTTEILYEDGKLVSASSRGNGFEGEEIRHNVETFKNVPLTIPYKKHLRVVGESIIHINDFEKINSKLSDDEKYKTPRNLVSGSVRQLDSSICAKRNVYFCPWDVLEGLDSDSRFDKLIKLNELGFTPNSDLYYIDDGVLVKRFDKEQLDDCINKLKDKALNKFIPIDGIVFKYNSISYSHSLGSTSHHNLDGYALKFNDDQYESIIRDIEWNTTRTGLINPTAIFDNIEIDGCDVSRASLSNLSIIENLQLHPNSHIMVSKRNMIIPHIEENLDRNINSEFEIPKVCPSCGQPTTIRNSGVAKVLMCENANCPSKQLDKFVHFCSKPALNIEGMSEATLEKFIGEGFIKTFADIYKLDRYKDKIIHMDGFGKKSYDKLWSAIQKSKEVTLDHFIVGLGIPNCGKTASKTISKYFNGDWHCFENAIQNNFDFTKLTDFGEIMNDAIYDWYYNRNEATITNELFQIVKFIIPEQIISTSNTITSFTSKKVYPTGTFANYKKDDIKNKLESLGAVISSGYAKSLDYLIVGSIKGSGKVQKAITDGVTVLTEDEFEEMIK